MNIYIYIHNWLLMDYPFHLHNMFTWITKRQRGCLHANKTCLLPHIKLNSKQYCMSHQNFPQFHRAILFRAISLTHSGVLENVYLNASLCNQLYKRQIHGHIDISAKNNLLLLSLCNVISTLYQINDNLERFGRFAHIACTTLSLLSLVSNRLNPHTWG